MLLTISPICGTNRPKDINGHLIYPFFKCLTAVYERMQSLQFNTFLEPFWFMNNQLLLSV